jgi:hypothetical protein
MVGLGKDPRDRRRLPRHHGTIEMHAFLGAGFLVAALLLPHARVLPVGGGIALAGAIRWGWRRLTR